MLKIFHFLESVWMLTIVHPPPRHSTVWPTPLICGRRLPPSSTFECWDVCRTLMSGPLEIAVNPSFHCSSDLYSSLILAVQQKFLMSQFVGKTASSAYLNLGAQATERRLLLYWIIEASFILICFRSFISLWSLDLQTPRQNSDSQTLPCRSMKRPVPCMQWSSHSPSQIAPFVKLYLPQPCCFPLRHQPSYIAPLQQTQVPQPCILSLNQLPLQYQCQIGSGEVPLTTSLPQPCFILTPLTSSQLPSQIVPSLYQKQPQPSVSWGGGGGAQGYSCFVYFFFDMKILQIYGPSTSASAELLALYFDVWTTGPPRSKIQALRSLTQQAHEFKLVITQSQSVDRSLFPEAKVVVFKECSYTDPELLYLTGVLANSGQGRQPLIPGRILTSSIPSAAIGLLMLMLSSHNQVKVDPLGVPLLINKFNLVSYQIGLLGGERSKNLLDGGSPFYKVHKTKDGVVAVGNLEPKFFKTMVDLLKFNSSVREFLIKHQSDPSSWEKIDQILAARFREESTASLVELGRGKQTCLSEVKQSAKALRSDIIKPIQRTKL